MVWKGEKYVDNKRLHEVTEELNILKTTVWNTIKHFGKAENS